MEMQKAYWATNGNDIRLNMSLSKVDQENRIVSGWATLDSADTQADVVLASASKNAFAQFRGNIREMHQPKAVGKMLNFREDMYFDSESGKVYRGIYVDVYVSRGAPDTWEKVLDGTLTGFSIGGVINEAEPMYDETLGKTLKVVTDYSLVELSLVDSPANQLANIVSITKVDGQTVLKGMVAEAKVENIFWCRQDEVCITSAEESVTCPKCSDNLENIGWVEEDEPEKTEKMRAAIAKARGSEEAQLTAENTSVTVTLENGSSFTLPNDIATEEIIKAITNALEGGNMAENSEVLEEQAEVVEAVAAEGEVEAEAVAEEVVEVTEEATPDVAAEVSEVDAEEPNFAKMFGDLQAAIESGLSKNREETTAAINTAVETFDGKVQELLTKHAELTKTVADISAKTEAVEKALAAVEDETAVKKSNDLGGSSEESLEKSSTPSWGGRFLSTSDL